MGKFVLRKTILRNMIDRVWAALQNPKIQHREDNSLLGSDAV
jgi:hypothetical protein